eukprot:IDg7276t1
MRANNRRATNALCAFINSLGIAHCPDLTID